jgi:hypothetical protein
MKSEKELRNKVDNYLNAGPISIYFEYDPYGSSTIQCSVSEFSSFFESKFFEYIFQTGDPVKGHFKVFKENNQIVIESTEKINIDRTYSAIFSGEEKEKLKCLIEDSFKCIGNDWYYNIQLSGNEQESDFNCEVYCYCPSKEEYVEMNIPDENLIAVIKDYLAELTKKINLEAFDLFLSNSEDSDTYVEYSHLRLLV